MSNIAQAPKIVDEVQDEGHSEAFLPYPDLGPNFENVPVYVRPDVSYYAARMGFMPNCNKLYMHVPWIADHLFKVNNAIMRDERNELSEHLKYKIAVSVARTHQCPYCTSHHAGTLKRRWEYSDDQLQNLLENEAAENDQEAVALEYANQASLDPAGVTPELRAKLAEHFTPTQVMEIVLCVGFWGMYAAMHAAMDLPIEQPVSGLESWMDTPLKA